MRRHIAVVLSYSAVLVLVSSSAPAAAGAQSLASVAAPASTLESKTVTPTLVACTDVPTAAVPPPALHVLAPHTGDLRRAVKRGEVVVLSGGTPQGLAVGQRYFTRRVLAPASREPISGVAPGSVRTTGWITVVAADNQFALAKVDYACVSLEAGDYLEAYAEPALPATIGNDGETDFSNMGRVLFGSDRREAFGPGDFLSIDRGSVQGLATGSRVAFYRDRGNGTPLYEVGFGVVLEVSAQTAKVVVERSTQDVRRGDFVGMRR